MFDYLKRSKRAAQVVMVIIIVPLAFFGVDSFFRGGGSEEDVATVGKTRIPKRVLDDTMSEKQNRMRQQLGDQFDPAPYNTPEMRYAELNQMIDAIVLEQKAVKDHFRASTEKVFDKISEVPAFQEDGKFSQELYHQVLRYYNKTAAGFEKEVQRELMVMPLGSVRESELGVASMAERYYRLIDEKRDIALANVDAASFIEKVEVSDEEIESHYTQNSQMFQTQEAVSIEYVKFNRSSLVSRVEVTEEEIKEAYERDKKKYDQPETREAAHILIDVARDATDTQKAEARAKAEDILNKAKAAPDTFAALAKEFSQDPGSAGQGGELGVVTKDSFVEPFADAVFAAQENGIVGPVETQFGFHIIKVTIASSRESTFEEVKSKVEDEVRQSKAANAFAEKANDFMNLVYEHNDSYEVLAETLGVSVSKAEFLAKAQVAQLADGHQPFADAVFSPDSLAERKNTDAIAIGSDGYISARVLDHKPVVVRPLEEVKASIKRLLENRKALELARADGEEKLAQLQQGKSAEDVELTFAEAVTINRQQQRPDITPNVKTEAFRVTDAGKLPVYLGAVTGSRYTIYRVEKITPAEAPDDAKKEEIAQAIAETRGREVWSAYLKNLREKSDININHVKLNEKKE